MREEKKKKKKIKCPTLVANGIERAVAGRGGENKASQILRNHTKEMAQERAINERKRKSNDD